MIKKILGYFSLRSNYKVDTQQAFYENDETGVYFSFEFQKNQEKNGIEEYPGMFNINYFRPTFYINEAELEVSAFVHSFDMVVSDPQTNGMGDGEYNSELLIKGWNHGNELGYSAILSDPQNRKNLFSLPTSVLQKAWLWNFRRKQLQAELGDSKFVPKVIFILLDGEVRTIAVWPDGIPIAIPEVGYLLIRREKLAPHQLFKKTGDQILLSLKDALPMLQKHNRKSIHDMLIGDN